MEASDGQTPDDHGIAFKIQCQSDKELLFRDNKRLHARSLRHWERKLIADKTRARAMRISRLKEENQSQLESISLGQQGYNVKSIRQAAIQGDIVRLQELLDAGFSGDASSAMGLTPLLGASQNGCLDAVKLLLQYDADVNHHHVKSGRTALMEAAARDNSDIVRELLRRHWFDEPNTIPKHHNRRSKRTQTTVPPTRGPPSLHSLPEDLQKEWEELQQLIKFKCSELKRLQTDEIPDVENGISRRRDGQSLATLAICVVEAEYLPFRDPRSKEPVRGTHGISYPFCSV
ncbi:hypothetical protein Poli38472_013950 [Pythium oligandrum]|uniref:Uncharacterized protein n=1 Tax=Pythium oligandrum TaxID=41045 RepID=A0A8K1C2E1_PYTOL|nr:hypothetical protein Poli38472_013950 [Pythium oligandrum]|eukprot:TMW55188.1 hypothetical protein Poli38472_013950 [Pythium oligandrum]